MSVNYLTTTAWVSRLVVDHEQGMQNRFTDGSVRNEKHFLTTVQGYKVLNVGSNVSSAISFRFFICFIFTQLVMYPLFYFSTDCGCTKNDCTIFKSWHYPRWLCIFVMYAQLHCDGRRIHTSLFSLHFVSFNIFVLLSSVRMLLWITMRLRGLIFCRSALVQEHFLAHNRMSWNLLYMLWRFKFGSYFMHLHTLVTYPSFPNQ